jgi:hypothetical protein
MRKTLGFAAGCFLAGCVGVGGQGFPDIRMPGLCMYLENGACQYRTTNGLIKTNMPGMCPKRLQGIVPTCAGHADPFSPQGQEFGGQAVDGKGEGPEVPHTAAPSVAVTPAPTPAPTAAPTAAVEIDPVGGIGEQREVGARMRKSLVLFIFAHADRVLYNNGEPPAVM